MSFLSEVQQFKRSALRKTETEVRTCDGKRYVETQHESGEYLRIDTGRCAEGWVVDLKPDLQVAEVRPGLCFGSQDVAADIALLRSTGVTHILNLAPGVENQYPDSFTYKSMPILDVPETDIIAFFGEAIKFIRSGLDSGGNVFVHCNAGVSRAPTIVAAYLMKTDGLSACDALKYIKSVRESVSPNKGFLEQLEMYDSHMRNAATGI